MQSHGPKRVYTPLSLEFWFEKLENDWAGSFTDSQLEHGRQIYRDGQVRELELTGQDAIVLGYQEDGPFDVRPARVRDRERIAGHDIYGKASVDRDIYTVRSVVRVGNSGGPLIDTKGSVLGIVFASALDSPDTGFVLTAQEVASDAAAGRNATEPVSTGQCD